MAGLSLQEVAARSGADVGHVRRLLELGLLVPDEREQFSIGDARRIGILRALTDAGLPLEGIAEGVRQDRITLAFADTATYDRFASLGTETFEEVSARTGVPVELLTMIREANGAGSASPTDLVREDELGVVPFIAIQVRLGFSPAGIERLLRVYGDSLQRMAQAEAEWFRTEVVEPNLAAGNRADAIANMGTTEGLSPANEQAVIAMLHAQEMQTWMSNIVEGFTQVLDRAGLHRATERHPAICFLDITGYTRLTQERGDRAAADLAEQLNRLVKRASTQHGGRPVKWLGDGVMCHFADPADGVAAALEMVEGIATAGLPPAHVGLHAGPLVVQEGDYYGQTVNVAARIADYARPGEVLVSDAVVRASGAIGGTAGVGPGITFDEVGDVELKGVQGAVHLSAARRAPAAG
jgi:adenylate cyclase